MMRLHISPSQEQQLLYIGRICRRFLTEEGGPIASLQVHCSVKEVSGCPGTNASVPGHLEKDIDIFDASDILCMAATEPLKGGKWRCKNIEEIETLTV